jgi:hypothetical protein
LDGMMFPPKMVNISEIIPDLTWMGMRPMQWPRGFCLASNFPSFLENGVINIHEN